MSEPSQEIPKVGARLLLAAAIGLLIADGVRLLGTEPGKFLDALLVEAHTIWLVLLATGLLITWMRRQATQAAQQARRRLRDDRVASWREALEDFQHWRSPESAHRSAGLLRRLQRHAEEVDYRSLYLAGANLQNMDFDGASLRGADLHSADLRNATLTGTNLTGCNLKGANLQQTNLAEATFDRTQLERSNLKGADLRNQVLKTSTFQGASLEDARLDGVDFEWAKLSHTDLTHAQLPGARLRFTELQGCRLARANLRNADLSGAFLQGADLRNAILSRASLNACHLEGADLTGADFQQADLRGAHLQGARLGDGHAARRPANLNGAQRNPDDPDVPGWLVSADGLFVQDDGHLFHGNRAARSSAHAAAEEE